MRTCVDCGTSVPPRYRRCETCKRALAVRNAREWALANPDRAAANRRRHYDANKERMTANAKKWAADNRERSREIKRNWNQRNPELVREINRNYYRANPDKVRDSAKAWREANPERWAEIVYANKMRREARKRHAASFAITPKELRRILASPCAVTGCARTDIQIDHILPLARGGSHGIGNLQPLCGHHNASKNDRTWMEFRVYLAWKGEVAA